MSTNKISLLLIPPGLLGLLAVLILFSPHELRYDEEFHIATALRVRSQGWHEALISPENSSAAGPLYSAAQLLFSDVTGLQPPAFRWINFAFLLLTIALTAMILRRNNSAPLSWFQAGSIMAVPFLWPAAGLALTELPALFFFTAFVAVMTSPAVFSAGGGRAGFYGVVGGGLLAISILGRQTYLVAFVPVMLMGFAFRKWRGPIIMCLATAITGCVWLFVIWRGLTPPSVQEIHEGLRLEHALYSLSYMGVASVFLGSSWLIPKTKQRWVAAIATGMMFALFTALHAEPPAKTLLVRALGASGAYTAGVLIRSLMCVLAMAWLIRMAEQAWMARRDPQNLLLLLLLLVLALAPARVAVQFSSRYVVGALTLQLVAQANAKQSGGFNALHTAIGGLVGALLLATYYW